METDPLLATGYDGSFGIRRGTVVTIAGAGNNFRLIQKRSRSILDKSYIDLLLIFVPFGIVGGVLNWPPSVVFALNFLALIPLENVFHLVAERLFLPWGDWWGTALSVVLPHVFPLIIGIISIASGQIELAQTFVIGSLLCNHLLGLGGCFLISSVNQQESIFPATGTNTEACLLYVLATPFAMCKLLSPEFLSTDATVFDAPYAILFLSRGSAVVLLIIYFLFLYFRLRSHRFLWQDDESIQRQDDLDEEKLPTNLFIAYLLILAVIIALSLICTGLLIDSIPTLLENHHLTYTFVGLVILPIITHLCKYIKTGGIAYQGHPEIAVAMTLGSSIDVSFLTLPVLVLVGWLIEKPMTMEFELLETIIVVLSIIVMAGFIMDGKSNYLEGCMSLGLYAIIVLTYAIIPDPPPGI